MASFEDVESGEGERGAYSVMGWACLPNNIIRLIDFSGSQVAV
jgi:hypothetical protein